MIYFPLLSGVFERGDRAREGRRVSVRTNQPVDDHKDLSASSMAWMRHMRMQER
jgi:hypothetical protein